MPGARRQYFFSWESRRLAGVTLQFFNALRYRALPAVENVHAVKQAAGIGRTFEQIYCFLPGIEFIFRHDDDRPRRLLTMRTGSRSFRTAASVLDMDCRAAVLEMVFTNKVYMNHVHN